MPYAYRKSDTYTGYIITLHGKDKYRWPQTEEQVKHQVGLLNDAYDAGHEDGYHHGFEDNECGCE